MENEINNSGSRFGKWFERSAGRPLKARDKIIGVILVVVFLFIFYVTLDANKYRAMVHVVAGEGKVGINPIAESLDFGDLSRGTSAVRKVDIKNNISMPMYVMVWKTGSISDLEKMSNNFFVVKPHGEEKIEFTAYIPASAEVDKIYSGRVYLFKIPTFWLIR